MKNGKVNNVLIMIQKKSLNFVWSHSPDTDTHNTLIQKRIYYHIYMNVSVVFKRKKSHFHSFFVHVCQLLVSPLLPGVESQYVDQESAVVEGWLWRLSLWLSLLHCSHVQLLTSLKQSAIQFHAQKGRKKWNIREIKQNAAWLKKNTFDSILAMSVTTL